MALESSSKEAVLEAGMTSYYSRALYQMSDCVLHGAAATKLHNNPHCDLLYSCLMYMAALLPTYLLLI